MDTIFQQEWEPEWEKSRAECMLYTGCTIVGEEREKPDSLPQEQEKKFEQRECMPDAPASPSLVSCRVLRASCAHPDIDVRSERRQKGDPK